LTLSFNGRGTAYRLGGDEFVLCIKEYSDLEEVEYTALKIISDFKQPFVVGEVILHTTF
jgi:GGDEF domain.